jgi:hypothetical protein
VRRLLTALAAVAGLSGALVAAGPAAADEVTASAGAVTATFSYTKASDYEYRDLRGVVTRDGVVVYDQPVSTPDCQAPFCVPYAIVGGNSGVRVVDLDGDGEPEVIFSVYTGGAHCCEETAILRWQGTGYATTFRGWGDFGETLADATGDGIPEFVTTDARFAYAFASFADSAFPVRVLSFRAGTFTDVTSSLRDTVAADATRWMKSYVNRHRGPRALGALAAWAADEYRLGHRAQVSAFLRHELRAGRLRAEDTWPARAAFITTLERRLRVWGYLDS